MKQKNKDKFVKGSASDFGETGGYFVGQFMGEREFSDLETDEVEIAWKELPEDFGDEEAHYHKVGVEINIVISGGYKTEVNGENVELEKGDFLVVYPQARSRNISAEPGTELIVVKAPSVADDKYEE